MTSKSNEPVNNAAQKETSRVSRRRPKTSFERSFKTLLEQMQAEHYHGSVLFTGEAGIGKTTAALNFGKTLGIPVVVIEVPHITEEHLINIPFIVQNQNDKTGGTSTAEVHGDPNSKDAKTEFWKDKGEYKIILANSVLYSTLTKKHITPDEEYLDYINNHAPSECRAMFFKYGGNENTIPTVFKTIRKKISVILFIDELYRTTTANIRNMLRGLMDGFIGKHKLPSSVFQVYASNMVDTGGEGGVEDVAEHEHYLEVDFTPPTKDEWFEYFISKYINHSVMNEQSEIVLDYFQEALEDQDISFTDYESSVRTSPRRWEQLLLYILSSIPTKSQADADALITHVKHNFIHYKTGDYSKELMEKVVAATREVIKRTSSLTSANFKDESDWKDELDHYIKQYMKIGSARKHVPVLSGLPGTTKTKTAYQLASDNHLDLIMVNATTLSRDDVEGQPVPQKIDSENDSVDVAFSPSKLYQVIVEGMREARAENLKMIKDMYADNPSAMKAAIQEYDNRRWKYLVFFDELNRVKSNTFNSLRKVLLEKEFGVDGDGNPIKLPKGTMFIAAINPSGKNTQEFTDHFRDVVDIIPVAPDFRKFQAYINSLSFSNADPEIVTNAKELLNNFIDAFNSGRNSSDKQFYMTFGDESYIDQRTLTATFHQLVLKLTSALSEVADLETEYDDATNEEKMEIIRENLVDALMMGLGFKLTHVNGVDRDTIRDKINAWLDTISDTNLEGLLSKRHGQGMHISKIYEQCIEGDIDIAQLAGNDNFLSHINEVSDQELRREVTSAIIAALSSRNNEINDMITTKTLPKLELVKGEYGLEIQKHGTEKETLLGYFSKGLLFSLMINQQSANRLTSMAKGMNEAVKLMGEILLQNNPNFTYDQVNEETGEKFTITDPQTAVMRFVGSYGVNLRSELQDMIEQINELYGD